MFQKALLAGGLVALSVTVANAADAPKELTFGVISTESSQALRTKWEPFIEDLQKSIGMPIKAAYATDYAGIIEGMRFGKVQLAWYGNKSAMEAVDRADGQVFVQSTSADGTAGYYSVILVHRDSEIKTLEDLLKNGKSYTFGNGDPNSTSGFLVPSYYVFAKNNVDPKTAFKRMVTANHETNILAVANKQLDAATNNTEQLSFTEKNAPEKFKEVRILWKSPIIPNDPIVWRKDLPDDVKAKLKIFFANYGVKGTPEEVHHAKEVLNGMRWGPFKESSDRQLIPIRQLELFRDRTKVANDESLAADAKKAKLAEFDAKLAELDKQAQGS